MPPPVVLSSVIPEHLVGTWLLAWNVLGFCAMLADKISAKLELDRISERALAYLALAGGVVGIILGGLFFHHKTSKPIFWVPVGFAALLWSALLLVYFFPRLFTL